MKKNSKQSRSIPPSRPQVVNSSGKKTTLEARVAAQRKTLRAQNKTIRQLKQLDQRIVAEQMHDSRDERFSLGLKDLKLGPFSLGSGSLSTRDPGDTVPGLAEYAQQIQVVKPRMKNRFVDGKPVDVWYGTDYLTDIGSTATTGNLAGDILFSFPINPNNFLKSRIAFEAPQYQRYRFKKLIFYYRSAAASTNDGELIGFGDYDVDNPLTIDAADNVKVAAAHVGQRPTKVWQSMAFPFGIVDDYTTLYCSLDNITDKRLVYQGQFYLLASTSLAPGLELGQIFVEYEIEFSIQVLQTLSASSWVPFMFAGGFSASTSAANLLGDGTHTNVLSFKNDLALGAEAWVSASHTLALTDIPNGVYSIKAMTFGQFDITSASANMSLTLTPISGTRISSTGGNVIPAGVTTTDQTYTLATFENWHVTTGELALQASITAVNMNVFAGTYPVTILIIERVSPLSLAASRPETFVRKPNKAPRLSQTVLNAPNYAKLLDERHQEPVYRRVMPGIQAIGELTPFARVDYKMGK